MNADREAVMWKNARPVSACAGAARRNGAGHRRALLACLLLLLVVLLLVLAALIFLRINSVSFSGSTHYGDEELFSASGLTLGDSMYRIDKKDIRENLLAAFPYLSSVTIRRSFPDKLVVTLEEYSPRFYTEIAGECFAIMEDLRVLERLPSAAAAAERGLIRLTLADGNYAVTGEVLGFGSEVNREAITEIMREVVASSLADRITRVNASDKYALNAVCDERYLLLLGDSKDVTIKLDLAEKILEDSMFNGNVTRAQIDLTDTKECGVIVDNQITFE